MIKAKQFITMIVLSTLVIGGVAAVHAPAMKERNLKVLPKDISDQKLDSIMPDKYCGLIFSSAA